MHPHDLTSVPDTDPVDIYRSAALASVFPDNGPTGIRWFMSEPPGTFFHVVVADPRGRSALVIFGLLLSRSGLGFGSVR